MAAAWLLLALALVVEAGDVAEDASCARDNSEKVSTLAQEAAGGLVATIERLEDEVKELKEQVSEPSQPAAD